MSRGLGKLQREIIHSLEAAKQSEKHYLGYAWFKEDGVGWVLAKGYCMKLGSGVYDLRASLKFLARRHDQITHCDYVSASFQANFSRAVKGLVQRGSLENLSLVPISEYSEIPWQKPRAYLILDLADGLYFNNTLRQVRFVKQHVYIHNSYIFENFRKDGLGQKLNKETEPV